MFSRSARWTGLESVDAVRGCRIRRGMTLSLISADMVSATLIGKRALSQLREDQIHSVGRGPCGSKHTRKQAATFMPELN